MNKINYNIGNVSFTINYDSEKNKMMKVTNHSGSKKKIMIRGFLSMDILPTNVWETEIDNGYYFKFSKKFNGYNIIEISLDGKSYGYFKVIPDKKKYNLNNKIICIGLNKTATTSLAYEMKKVGYKTLTQPLYDYLRRTSNSTDITNVSTLLEHTDLNFFDDSPFSYPTNVIKIIKKYPNCKYILTKRKDTELWVDSFINHYNKWIKGNIEELFNGKNMELNSFNYNEGTIVYGEINALIESYQLYKYDGNFKEKLFNFYENYNKKIKILMESNEIEWIEIDASKDGELKKLTDWLSIENNKNNFSWINKGKYGN
jgi:hypothetical protein